MPGTISPLWGSKKVSRNGAPCRAAIAATRSASVPPSSATVSFSRRVKSLKGGA